MVTQKAYSVIRRSKNQRALRLVEEAFCLFDKGADSAACAALSAALEAAGLEPAAYMT